MSLCEVLNDLKELLTDQKKDNNKINGLTLEDIVEEDYTPNKEVLENATLTFFPKTGVWKSSCFGRPKQLRKTYLPCHLRDDLWLAQMLQSEETLNEISINQILNFVRTSEFFQEKRHEYEEEIVRWQIEYMVNGGEGWIAKSEFGGDFITFSPICDIGFRVGIVETLGEIGIDKEAIEEGIEKNANLWRDKYIRSAFMNTFYPIIGQDIFDEFDNELHEKWIKMRLYEYYQDHKDSVDKYGSKTSEMEISEDEVQELRNYLEIKNRERQEALERIEKENNELIKRLSNN